ncbi:MAG: LLM class F420-dependent oxidoreductase [Thermoleophilia bacterium]
MRIGVFCFLTAWSIQPIELGRALEQHGLDSLFLPEHTHIPVDRRTPFPIGGELPRYYAETYDPFVALATVAATTERLGIGTGVCLLIQRDPIVTAKEVASLDVLSAGRFELGVGAGWNREEIENHGTDFPSRWKLLRERVEAMRAIWTQDEASYAGELVSFEPLRAEPKPLQRPHPPVLLGSNAPRAIDRVLRYADGWMPSTGMGGIDLVEGVAELRRRAEELGRPRPPVTVFGGDGDEGELARLAAAGVDRVLLRLPTAPAAEVLPIVERYGRLAGRLA